MDEKWPEKSFLIFLNLFSFGSTDVLKRTESPDPANSSSLGKMVWEGFGQL